MTSYDLRLATAEDGAALARLRSESFGYPAAQPPFPDPQGAGRTTYVVEHDDQVVAVLMARAFESWFWGARVPTAGIAGVKIAPELRGKGLLTPLFERSLAEAVEAGAVISTLYATAPGIYRKFGYETFASFDQETVVPTASVAQVRSSGGSVHRGGLSDIPTMRWLYDEWAAPHNGPLVRSGPSFSATDAELAEQFTGLTIARDDDGSPSGYAIWERTGGYTGAGVLAVHELVAVTEQGMRRLLALLGGDATLAPTTIISTSQPDLARLVLPSNDWQIRLPRPYSVAVLDVAGALIARPYPEWLDLDLTFAVAGMFLPGQDGAYRLRIRDGSAEVTRVCDADLTYAARGFALRFAGTHSSTDLRRAGLLTGDAADGSRWDAAFSGRQAHIRSYF